MVGGRGNLREDLVLDRWGEILMEICGKEQHSFRMLQHFLCFLGCFLDNFVVNLEKFLKFIVEHQDESASSTTENVGQSSLEEGTCTFL